MRNRMHIIITGEDGNTWTFLVSKSRLFLHSLLLVTFCTLAGYGGFALLDAKEEAKFSAPNAALQEKIATLESENEKSRMENQELRDKVSELEYALEEPLKTAVGELNERSKIIENILNNVGIDIEKTKGRGGPFIELPDDSLEGFIGRIDRYLNTIQPVPLGFPTSGDISAGFGPRKDPMNGRPAFHAGFDIQAAQGTGIVATASGRIVEEGFDGEYGRFIVIDHGNGFKTLYGHNSKNLVKKGEAVQRGQLIALMGSTGRSTGSHVHYELRYKDKTINPATFAEVAAVASKPDKRKDTLKN